MNNNKKYFTDKLLLWNQKENHRQMPWKGENDPYKIWLSENTKSYHFEVVQVGKFKVSFGKKFAYSEIKNNQSNTQ